MQSITLVLVDIGLAVMMLRHSLVCISVCRSAHFLRTARNGRGARRLGRGGPRFIIVVPVLREANTLRAAVEHLELLKRDHQAQILVVTTEREVAEKNSYPDAGDTIRIASALSLDNRITHLHYEDPLGVKADQLNCAVAYCEKMHRGELNQVYIIVYDADSRPPVISLDDFSEAIQNNPTVDVFHQSSRFELRRKAGVRAPSWRNTFEQVLVDSGALRANRFVLSYELPRLMARTGILGKFNRWVSSCVYTHVTGHGLCVRASLLKLRPFPSRSPLEDMHYSFILGSHNTAMVPIQSLDSAEVPETLRRQFIQATSWFQGPARFKSYLKDNAIKRGLRAKCLALSAAAISIEWLSCAIMPTALFFWALNGQGSSQLFAAGILLLFLIQVVISEIVLGGDHSLKRRVARVALFPMTVTIFGLAGWVGVGKLLGNRNIHAKTER